MPDGFSLNSARSKPDRPPASAGGVSSPDRYRVMARADAVNAVAAGLAITERGLPVWPPAAFDLADVLTEYILTGERPT